MATLVSPGVSVTVTNESYFVPASAPTVPLIILATRENKPVNPANPSGPIAPGTQEYGVVRTITSLQQSEATFGIPYFNTTNGQPNHGDSTNECGLAALDMFLTQGDFAYTVRANVNLDTNFADIQALWNGTNGDIPVAVSILESLVSQWIVQYNTSHNLTPATPSTPGVATVNYGGVLTNTTTITPPASMPYTATVQVADDIIPLAIDLSALAGSDVAGFIAALNATLGAHAVASISGGNIIITSTIVGSTATVVVTDTGLNPLFTTFGAQLTPPVVLTPLSFTTVPGVNGYAQTIDTASLLALIQQATAFIWQDYNFGIPTVPTTLEEDFLGAGPSTPTYPLPVYANGFTSPTTGNFYGIQQQLATWFATLQGGAVAGQLTPTEAGNLLQQAGDDFEWTNNFLFKTSLGTDDATRRANIVTALLAIINSNQEIISETIQYNLILCPGYPECSSALDALCINQLNSEVQVIGDTPMNADMNGGSTSITTWAASTARVVDIAGNICYYYPHILTTNLDGATILVPSSAQALTTMAYSDNLTYEWFAPAGLTRGIITGITDIGYFVGTPGTATTFVSLHPNQGQRDVLYAYTASGDINPLAYFPGSGFVVWGQKNSVGTTASSLDRINVSRLVKYIARSLSISAKAFVFEPNDSLTQNNLKTMVDSFLGNLITQRGLYDFATVCDSSNNTPAVVQSNSLIIDVALQPTITAEFIYIPITIVATGATLNTGGATPSA